MNQQIIDHSCCHNTVGRPCNSSGMWTQENKRPHQCQQNGSMGPTTFQPRINATHERSLAPTRALKGGPHSHSLAYYRAFMNRGGTWRVNCRLCCQKYPKSPQSRSSLFQPYLSLLPDSYLCQADVTFAVVNNML